MANKTKANRRRSNPLVRRAGIGRPRIAFNGHSVTSSNYVNHSVGIGNQSTDWQAVDCSANEGMNRAGHDIVKHYNEYKYTSASVEWIPKIGPSSVDAGVTVMMAYFDNPEFINTYKAATFPNRIAMIRAQANCKTFNLWERFTYRVPLTHRRKWFNVNPTIGSATNNEETDRSIQGLVGVAIDGVISSATPPAGSLGQYRTTCTTIVQGFSTTAMT